TCIRHYLEGLAGGRAKTVDDRDVERAVERGVALDGELVELSWRGSPDVDVEPTGRGLRVVPRNGQHPGRGAGIDDRSVGEIAVDLSRTGERSALQIHCSRERKRSVLQERRSCALVIIPRARYAVQLYGIDLLKRARVVTGVGVYLDALHQVGRPVEAHPE